MNRILYQKRCKCETKRTSFTRSKGRPLRYPNEFEYEMDQIRLKTFQVKYEKKLSLAAKCILHSFQKKYIYYAIDDILYSFKRNPVERDNLLAVLYSPILSLHNNFHVNFFDIWIDEIYIDKISKVNRFLNTESQTSEQFNYITLKFVYKIGVPVKKQESLW